MHRGKALLIPFVVASSLFAGNPSPPVHFKFDAALEGVVSRYTPVLLKLVRQPGALEQLIPFQGEYPVGMQCFSTEKNNSYVGIGQKMNVAAPLTAVDAVLSDIDHYKEIFPGYADIHVERRDDNKWLTYWEQRVPIPFVSNVKYWVWYLIDHSQPGVVIYRYQLQKSEKLKASDGFIILEPRGASGTKYFEMDFWDADYGLLKTFAPKRIWEDSVEGIFLSDLGIKIKSEHPDWTYEKIRAEAKLGMKDYPLKQIAAGARPLPAQLLKD